MQGLDSTIMLQISSTEVRRALALGKMRRVRDYLGRPYHLLAILPELQLQEVLRYNSILALNLLQM